MKYSLVKLVTNDKEQTVGTVEVKDSFDSAVVAYHQILAAYHNAADVLYAVVEILDEYGRILNRYSEVVDHRPQPEPETEES